MDMDEIESTLGRDAVTRIQSSIEVTLGEIDRCDSRTRGLLALRALIVVELASLVLTSAPESSIVQVKKTAADLVALVTAVDDDRTKPAPLLAA